MRIVIRIFSIFLLFQISATFASVRPEIAAGSFYPKNSEDLKSYIVKVLHHSPVEYHDAYVRAIIVPHAGYAYSGKLAAQAFKQLQGLNPKRIIIIGPAHFVDVGENVVLPNANYWRTPLGEVAIDQQLRDDLLQEGNYIISDDQPHVPEHAVEVELPFLQVLFPEVPILPIAINSIDRAQEFAALLSKYVDRQTLLIISTDMSHYYPALTADAMDGRAIKDIVHQDIEKMVFDLKEHTIEMCGAAAVTTLLALVKQQGGMEVENFGHNHSGQMTGDPSRVVGYFSGGVYRPKSYQALLDYGYEVLKYYLETGRRDAAQLKERNQLFDSVRGLFVTLRLKPTFGQKEGALRGCLGHVSTSDPLKESVRLLTIASASEDSRFNPVTIDELPNIEIGLSILTHPKIIDSYQDIQLGRQGVIVSQGQKSGIFLPEVAELFKSKDDFLAELCTEKAHLNSDCYKDPATKIKVFETITFR